MVRPSFSLHVGIEFLFGDFHCSIDTIGSDRSKLQLREMNSFFVVV